MSRTPSPKDDLDTLFDLIEVRGVISGGFAVGGRWRTEYRPAYPLKLLVVARGRTLVSVDGMDAPLLAEAGDVVVLIGCQQVALQDPGSGTGLQTRFTTPAEQPFLRVGDGEETVVLGGHIDLEDGTEPVLRALSDKVLHLGHGAHGQRLGSILRMLFDEAVARPEGSGAAMDLHARLVVLEVLRAAHRDGSRVGWAQAMLDPGLRPALLALHRDPGHPWELADLAVLAAMSRSGFVQRFTSLVGKPPLRYLTGLRMQLARRRLRDSDAPVDAIARALGYSTGSAFTAAFRREIGVSPRTYRRSSPN